MTKVKFAYDVIRLPVNTEKARLGWGEQPKGRWYTFEVEVSATKPQNKAAVEDAFKVRVRDVRTLTKKGKFRRRRTAGGYTSAAKRAIVTLEPGEKIGFFEGI